MTAERYSSFRQVPNFGVMGDGLRLNGDNFALHASDFELQPCFSPFGSSGAYMTHISPTNDERCASFWPGGIFEDNVLILSEVFSEMPSKQSESIVRAFATAVKKISVGKARGCVITHGAKEFIANGGLLTDHYVEGLPASRFIALDEIA